VCASKPEKRQPVPGTLEIGVLGKREGGGVTGGETRPDTVSCLRQRGRRGGVRKNEELSFNIAEEGGEGNDLVSTQVSKDLIKGRIGTGICTEVMSMERRRKKQAVTKKKKRNREDCCERVNLHF